MIDVLAFDPPPPPPPHTHTHTHTYTHTHTHTQRMWLIPLMNFLLLFEISMIEMRTNFEDVYIGPFSRNAPNPTPPRPDHDPPPLTLADALLYFLSGYRTCSIEPPKSFHGQITSNVLEDYRCFTERRTHCSYKNASKPSRTCTGITKTQIH